MLWGMLGETTTVVSVGEREAMEVVDKAQRHADALVRLGSEWARRNTKVTSEVQLPHGGRVLALPATSGGRSFSGNVILDEFAYHKDPKRVWDGAGGTVLHGYRLRVLSTPNGVGNLFHDMWTDEHAHHGYSLHSVTLEEAVADGLRVDMGECWKMARNDPRVFDQLFRCKFLDNEQQYIPSDLIEAASVEDIYAPEGETFAGLDVGRTANLTVLVIIRVHPQTKIASVIHVDVRKRTAYEDLETMVAHAVRTMKCRRVAIDATGMGAYPAEQLQKKHGTSKVEPFQFTLQSKEDLASTMFQRFADRTIRIPRRDAALRDDVASIRRVITVAGNVRYDAPDTVKGHADRGWALALALHACAHPPATKTEVLNHRPETERY